MTSNHEKNTSNIEATCHRLSAPCLPAFNPRQLDDVSAVVPQPLHPTPLPEQSHRQQARQNGEI